MDTVITKQYDWTEDNYRAVIGLRVSLSHQYKKGGLSPSRAMNQASDDIASKLMNPPKTGQELDSWLGQMMQSARRYTNGHGNGHSNGHSSNGNGNNHHKADANSILAENSIEFSIPAGLIPPAEAPKKSAKWAPVIAVLRDLPVNEWKPLLFKSQNDARSAAGVLGYHAKRTLKLANYGLSFQSRADKANPLLLWIIKQKK